MAEREPNSAPGNNQAGHEITDVDIWRIVLTGVGLAVVAGIILTIGVGLFRYFVETVPQPPDNPMAVGASLPAAPHIEEHPASELQALRQQEDMILHNYGWVDKKAGKVRIPIDRAMDLILQRGFPTRKETAKR